MSHDTTTTAEGNKTIPMLPVGYQVHTSSNPFCWDSACACHQNSEARIQVELAYREGLCTVEEAVRIIAGQQM